MATRVTSREFNQDTAGAKRAASAGPVYVTDRGVPAFVLLTFADYCRLAADRPSIVELLSQPVGVEEIEFEPPTLGDVPEPARLD